MKTRNGLFGFCYGLVSGCYWVFEFVFGLVQDSFGFVHTINEINMKGDFDDEEI
ncbi:MAG: hypothetical protein LUG21_07475 [Clostridiales bacterium]|nr:hypothetical protein [Clostridiales bacterium]